MTRVRRIAVAAALATILSTPAWAGQKAAELPPPDTTSASLAASAYRIGPADKLDVNVFQVKDLTGTVDVDAAGKISLPLVGSIQAAGRTTTELSKDIADRLRGGYVQDPQVTVVVKEALSQKVTVEGAVQKPGVYPITGPTTLSTAVALAAGADPARANERHVRVMRMVGGKRVQASYNLAAINNGKAVDPPVYGNDIIVVESSQGQGLLRDIATAAPLLYLFTVW
jgi:polysaccharide export outer membrane protein